jgi:hypothetical protein
MPKHNLCLAAFSGEEDKPVNMLLPANSQENFSPENGRSTYSRKE